MKWSTALLMCAVSCCVFVGVVWYYTTRYGYPISFASHHATSIEHVTFYAQRDEESSERIMRHGILYKKPDAKATVVVCHGFMCDKSDVRCLQHMFRDYNVFFFDFRAHGEEREGQLCTFGHDEVHDIRAAVDYIKERRDMSHLPLIAYAFSMGSVTSINAQAYYGDMFDGAIWDCPFDSTDALLLRILGDLHVTILGYTFDVPGQPFLRKHVYNRQFQAFIKAMLRALKHVDAEEIPTCMMPVNTVSAARRVTIPAFFITCVNDDKAPPEAVQKVYEAHDGYKRLWVTAGRRHYDSYFYNPEEYEKRVRAFIERVLDGSYKQEVQEQAEYVEVAVAAKKKRAEEEIKT